MKKLPSSPVKRVAFYNNKGGAGKTTFSVHTAFLAEEWLLSTFLACLDRQGNSLVWLSGGDGVAREQSFYERSEHLSVIYSPQVMPDLENVDVVLADCPPEIEIALTVNPTLWVVPVHGRMGFQGLANVVQDLVASKAEVLVVRNNVGRGGPSVQKSLQEALSHLKGVTIYPEDIIESDTIIRAEEWHEAAWRIPHSSKSKGAAAMKRLCEYILKRCGFSPRKGS
jgi:cellulose biosynthesis protein BcsQ